MIDFAIIAPRMIQGMKIAYPDLDRVVRPNEWAYITHLLEEARCFGRDLENDALLMLVRDFREAQEWSPAERRVLERLMDLIQNRRAL